MAAAKGNPRGLEGLTGLTGLTGKTVWVVGAAGGLGSRFSTLSADSGARLVLSGGPAEQLAEQAQRFCSAVVVPLDLTDSSSLAPAVEAADGAFSRVASGVGAGGVDLLVLNAGISQRALAVDTDLAVLKRLIDIDFVSQAEIARLCARRMVERGSGTILVVSSLAGVVASPLRSGYCAAKHAIHGYYNALRAELAGSGVSVTIGVPGFVRTDISLNAVTADGGAYGRMDPNQQGGTAPEVVAHRLLRAAVAGRREVRLAMGLKGRLAMALNVVLPGLFARVIAKARVT